MSLNTYFSDLKCVLVDVDNTLLDFEKSSQLAIKRTCEDFNIKYSEQLLNVFLKVNNDMWRKIQDGKLTKAQLWQTRWNTIFGMLSISADGPLFEAEFHKHLENCSVPVVGALDTLRYLHSKYKVCTASNASLKQQQHRLKLAGMSDYIDKMFVSEQLGAQKPSPIFFDACFKQLNIAPSDTLMIGDDLHADMLGANCYGVKTCWFNPKCLLNTENIKIDIEIKTLEALQEII